MVIYMLQGRISECKQDCNHIPVFPIISGNPEGMENEEPGNGLISHLMDHPAEYKKPSPEIIPVYGNEGFKYQIIEDSYDLHDNNFILPRFSGEHVLLAEDNPTNMLLAIRLLEKAGLEVIPVNNGQEALDALHTEKGISCVILDIHMPVMDGIRTCSMIREGEDKDVPVLALTAFATDDVREQCRRAGFDAFITKPISCRQFYEILQKIF